MRTLVIRFLVGILLLTIMMSCGKLQSDYSMEIVEEFELQLPTHEFIGVSWSIKDLYIFPMINNNSVLKIRAYDVNIKELVWEVNAFANIDDFYKGKVHDDQYLSFYGADRVRILDINSMNWHEIYEDDILDNYRGSGNGITYFDGRFYGTLTGTNQILLVYSYDIISKQIQIEYEYQTDSFEAVMTGLYFEYDSANELNVFLSLYERRSNDVNDLQHRWKLLSLSDWELQDEFIFNEGARYSAISDYSTLSYNQQLIININNNIFFYDKENREVTSQKEFSVFLGSTEVKINEDEMYVNDAVQMYTYSFHTGVWETFDFEEPNTLSDLQFNNEYITYKVCHADYSMEIDVYCDLFVYNTANETSFLFRDMPEDHFSSPKYYPQIDTYVYHSDSKIRWVDIVEN